MQFKLKPSYEKSKKRYEAFWEQEIIDRPPVNISFRIENPQPLPQREYDSQKERWLDIDFRAEWLATRLENVEYFADSLPIAWPNLGPEILSAWFGCDYIFGQNTTWSEPCIEDWEKDAEQAVFNPENPLFKKTVEYTEKLLELGDGKFIVGLTDLHPGGDNLAALRDPQNLAMDLVMNKEYVKEKLEKTYDGFFRAYNIFYDMLREKNMPITTFLPLIHDGKFYVIANDFAAMISNEMYEEFFLPGILKEIEFYERTIYHVDGPGNLTHLDTILSIPELDAVQWVPTTGDGAFTKWLDIYKKIQKSGKSMELKIHVDELPLVFKNLKPEGIFFRNIRGIQDRKTAERVLKRIEKWS